MTENIDDSNETWNTFTIDYTEAGLQVYNEEYFRQLGLKSHVTVLVNNGNGSISMDDMNMNTIMNPMHGGVRHSTRKTKHHKYVSLTMPYKYFYHRMKYISDSMTSFFNPLTKTVDHVATNLHTQESDVPRVVQYVPSFNKNTEKEEVISIPSLSTPIENISPVSMEKEVSPSSVVADGAPEIKTSISNPTADMNINNSMLTENKSNVVENIPDENKMIKIEIEGELENIDSSKYKHLLGLSKFYLYLWTNQKVISKTNTYVINDKIVVLGKIENGEETIQTMFQREHSNWDIHTFENTEAYKIILL
jgi:hypothetical protein